MAYGCALGPIEAFAFSLILVFPAVALALPPVTFGRPMPAWYERGNTTFSHTVDVGPTGASIRVPARGSPLDGTVLNIPAGAVDNPVTISIGYNVGLAKQHYVPATGNTSDGTILIDDRGFGYTSFDDFYHNTYVGDANIHQDRGTRPFFYTERHRNRFKAMFLQILNNEVNAII